MDLFGGELQRSCSPPITTLTHMMLIVWYGMWAWLCRCLCGIHTAAVSGPWSAPRLCVTSPQWYFLCHPSSGKCSGWMDHWNHSKYFLCFSVPSLHYRNLIFIMFHIQLKLFPARTQASVLGRKLYNPETTKYTANYWTQSFLWVPLSESCCGHSGDMLNKKRSLQV